MTQLVRTIVFVGLGCGVMACATGPRPASKTSAEGVQPMVMEVGGARIEIEKAALAFPKPSGRFAGWLGYALVRRVWLDGKFRERFPREGKYNYTFEEELDARESATKIWGELNEKEHLTDPYFGELQKIDSAGFFREYVWYCIPHPTWKPAAGLRQEAFARWMSAELPNHRVETWVLAIPGESGGRVVLGAEPHRPTTCRVPLEETQPSTAALNPTGAGAPTG